MVVFISDSFLILYKASYRKNQNATLQARAPGDAFTKLENQEIF